MGRWGAFKMSTEPEGWYIDAGPPAKPRRSRANLRPRSRSASVIDRLLKNQNPLENRNNLRSSSPHPGPGQTSGEPRRNFAVRNSSTPEPWLFRSPVFGSGIDRWRQSQRLRVTSIPRQWPAGEARDALKPIADAGRGGLGKPEQNNDSGDRL